MICRIVVGAAVTAAAVTACSDDGAQSPGGDGVAGVIDGDGLVYDAPVDDRPPPQATLDPQTPVSVLCKAPQPGETLELSEAVMSVFYEISYDGGTGYARQHDVELVEPADYSLIPEC
ncbi:MAG: hypothetical protein SW019_19070 [Actinomycetota bacterium]|nr:hypothetical protein [Actinomycetota bacterium]